MRFGMFLSATFSAVALAAFAGSAFAQTLPPESATKVKRVMLYGKVGGWINTTGYAEIRKAFESLALSKGFILDNVMNDAVVTPEYLKQYQVIVWNNNSNGAASMPSAVARSAVIDYVQQGGGWMLIGRAGDHVDTWQELSALLGTKFTVYSNPDGLADIMVDSSAKLHPELRHVVSAIPDTVRFRDSWLSFQNTVRPLEGVTILYTAGNGQPMALAPNSDQSADHPYVWARPVDEGKLLYNAIGQLGDPTLDGPVTTQADSAVTRLYWQSLRWLAGDFKNGCMDPASSRFDSEARIDDGSCALAGIRSAARGGQTVVAGPGRTFRLDSRPAGGARVLLRDFRGGLVRRLTVPAGSDAVTFDGDIQSGIYHLEARIQGESTHYRLVIP